MTNERITIKRLQAGDIAAFRQLIQLFSVCFEDAKNYLSAQPTDAYLADLLEKEGIIPLVATLDEDVAGGLVAYELDKFEQQRREFYIYDLAVYKQFRRRGIASRMIDHIRGIARHRQAWVVYVQADYEDEPAVALYTKFGRREDVMHFDIEP